jgi:deoxyguanosine kinase
MKYNYIAIEGNIGVGKTTLSGLIARESNYKLILEEFEENHFLPLFYEHKERYAFHTEISFLIQRFEQLMIQKKTGQNIIADYYFMKTLIFAKNNLTEIEFDLFSKLYKNLKDALPTPDLIVFLHRPAKILINNIHRRGRDFERNITLEYLVQIENQYLEYIEKEKSNLRILNFNIDNTDFLNDPNQFKKIYKKLKLNYPIGITQINI